MEEKQIIDIQRKVSILLQSQQLKKAIEALGEDIESLSDWELRSRYSEISTSYGYLLEYFEKGMHDPERHKLHKELIGKCFVLNDEIAVSRMAEKSFAVYSQYKRKYKNETAIENLQKRFSENAANIAVANLLKDKEHTEKELQEQHEKILQEAYYRIWCSSGWRRNESEGVLEMLTNDEIDVNDRATLVSAIFLGLLKCFEPIKVITLCRLAQHKETEIAIRSLTGVLIAILVHENRIKFYPEIVSALQTLKEDGTITRRIATTQIQLLRCRETQKIDRKMREEIIPAMMKNPGLGDAKMGMDIIKELEENDQNPEWKEWIEKDKIKDKLEEMTKWQIEGADVYMSTFSQLKRFPFFSEICNWVRPFDTNIPQIAEIMPRNSGSNKSILGAICASRVFCNSDKYSFCFTFKQVPQEQRDMLMQQITEGNDLEAIDSNTVVPKEKIAEQQSNQYIQDLYRFFKISDFRKDFIDPFTLPLNIVESSSLSFLVDESKTLAHIFNYLIEKEYYSEAYNVGVKCETRCSAEECDALFYQKMGYSLQKQGEYRKAIDYYTKADIIKPDTLWTIRHIAQCYRLLGELSSALHYYETAEKLAPENNTLLMQIGECYTIKKRYDEAFARFFKVEFASPQSLKAWRAIAWCSFLVGKDEQAERYYEKILNSTKTVSDDFLNAAHVQFVNNNISQAILLYRKAKEMSGNKGIIPQILNDREALISRGINEEDITLLCDIIG